VRLNPCGARVRRLACASLAGAAVLAATVTHAEPCRIARAPDIPVTMRGLRPMVRAQINGQDGWFIADSGAFFSFLTPPAVRQFQLSQQLLPGLEVQSLSGRELARVARVRKFTLIGYTWNDVEFVVTDSTYGSEAVGLLGQNVFRIADVEYDLANGVIRLVKPKGDCRGTALAYWAEAANKPYSVIQIEPSTVNEPHTKSVAYLNGAKIHVLFDTGSAQSLLTLRAAKQAGITPSSPGVTDGGAILGRRGGRTWITRFASFRIGDEEIQHAQLRIGDVDLLRADMLIGADFFLSHRIYVASSQGKLYFTYNGGPVFDLAATPAATAPDDRGGAPAAPAETAAAPAGTADAATAASLAAAAGGEPVAAEYAKSDLDVRLDRPTDAAGYARRGAASAARHDYDAAIADLTRACELAPTQADYFYQRGIAHWSRKQVDLALTDFDEAVRLKPDYGESLLARASLRAGRHDAAAEVSADLDAADRSLPKEADARLRLGSLYEDAGQPAAAVVQYTKWIDSHPRDDPRMASVFNSRCWVRTLSGQALDLAIADCNAALRMRPNTAAFLDSRGLAYLRQSNYDRAIADYDAALRLRPKIAWSLYGRGLARQHKGMTAEARADIDAATALQPQIADMARKYGIGP
jgi:tetratricopeptide (TPR) repeat protein